MVHQDQHGLTSEDHPDVQIASLADGQVLAYEVSSGKWKNVTPSGAGSVPCARAYRGSNQSINNTTWTVVNVDTGQYDTGSFLGSSRFNISTTGKYRILAQVAFQANATGFRAAQLMLNGSTSIAYEMMPNTNPYLTYVVLHTDYNFTAGQYIEIQAWQNSGGALNVTSGVGVTFWSISLIETADVAYGNGFKGLFGRVGDADYLDSSLFRIAFYNGYMNANNPGHIWWQNSSPAWGGSLGTWYNAPGAISNVVFLMAGTFNPSNFPANKRFDILARWCVGTSFAATAYCELSWSSSTGGPRQTNQIAFEFARDLGDTNYMAVIRSTAGGAYRVSTGITATANVMHKFCISVDWTGQVAYFYIDDVLVNTINAATAGGWPVGLSSVGLRATPNVNHDLNMQLPWIIAQEV